jgi:hypothetical protein
MTKQKKIPIKSYYQRAKVFGYLALIIALSLVAIYIFEHFIEN